MRRKNQKPISDTVLRLMRIAELLAKEQNSASRVDEQPSASNRKQGKTQKR